MMLRNVLSAAMVVGATACMTVRPVVEPASYIPENNPERIWVVNADNEVFIINYPRVEGQNLVGTPDRGVDQLVIPLARTRLVEAKQHDRKKTAILGVTLGALIGGAVYFAVSAGNGAHVDQERGEDQM